MFIKRVVILSGEISGSLKIEAIGDNCSCVITLMALHCECRAIVKVGNSPIVVQHLERLKTAFRINCALNADCDIVCLVVGEQSNVLARGKTSVGGNYNSALTEYEKCISAAKLSVIGEALAKPSTVELAGKIAEVIGAAHLQELQIAGAEQEGRDESNAESGCVNCDVASTVILRSDESGGEPFYVRVADRLEELFTQYPHDLELEQLVYSSRWARVEYDDANYYVVGVIEEDGKPLFICYGVPVDSKSSHQVENEHCEWLPTARDDNDGKGYWVLYQDANTGETLT